VGFKQRKKKCGILGKVIALAPAHDKKGQQTLYSHWQIWVEEISTDVRESLWNEDAVIQEKACKDFYTCVDGIMNASYLSKLNFNHECTHLHQQPPKIF
jgi:hypothetical protein